MEGSEGEAGALPSRADASKCRAAEAGPPTCGHLLQQPPVAVAQVLRALAVLRQILRLELRGSGSAAQHSRASGLAGDAGVRLQPEKATASKSRSTRGAMQGWSCRAPRPCETAGLLAGADGQRGSREAAGRTSARSVRKRFTAASSSERRARASEDVSTGGRSRQLKPCAVEGGAAAAEEEYFCV